MQPACRTLSASAYQWVMILGAALALAGCGESASPPPAAAASSTAAIAFRPRATIAEIMESMVMPSADVIWNATAVDTGFDGVKDYTPKNDEDWEHIEWASVTLAEAMNAVLVPGRRVDHPGAVAASPEFELGPDRIQEMLAKEPGVWAAFAQELDGTVQQIQQAIRDRNVKALGELGGTLDEVCEGCHLHFWYPNDTTYKK